jgi:hypothetical protein
MEQLMGGKIPMPETSDWKSSCGSWEGFCKIVRKSIANNLGSGIIKFNKMTNHLKIIELNRIWYDIISSECGHKDRDCHFRINTHYFYGSQVEYEVEHHGYILHDKEAEFGTLEEAENYLINDVLKKGIIEEVEFYLEHYGDPDWDQHGRYNKQELESLKQAVLDISS